MTASSGKPAPSSALPRTEPERGTSRHPRYRAAGRKAVSALLGALGGLGDRATDRILLTDVRVTSAAEGRRVLAGDAGTEALAEKIQRAVVLSVPVVRMFARGARFTGVPWVMVGSSAVSVGVSSHTGARELQVLTSLVAHRLEESTGAPADPRLVKKVAIDLYLKPKGTPDVSNDKLRLVRLTRKWVWSGAFGRKTARRTAKALAAAERFDPAALSAQWAAGPGADGSP
jgi:hypothetical protein